MFTAPNMHNRNNQLQWIIGSVWFLGNVGRLMLAMIQKVVLWLKEFLVVFWGGVDYRFYDID